MYTPIVIAAATTADLEPAAVTPDWVLNGMPETRSKKLARSHDRTSHVMVWDCTAGHFNWYYDKDETLVVISGEAFITNEKGEERQLGPGDVVFFPAGTSSTWRVPCYIKGRNPPAYDAAAAGIRRARLELAPPDRGADAWLAVDAGLSSQSSRHLTFLEDGVHMNRPRARLRPGDLVEIRAADEILQTLDVDGTLD